VIGILGGIGSGKSAVARLLEELGAGVVDADRIAVECLALAQVRHKIGEAFGKVILPGDGGVDRKALADLVFSSEENRRTLHAIIHPEIRARMRKELEVFRALEEMKQIIIDAPLLLESEFLEECDVLLLVRSPLETRISRVRSARGWDAAELKRRESLQVSLSEKENAADVIIENSGTPAELRKRVTDFSTALNAGFSDSKYSPDAPSSGTNTTDLKHN
jgi:dephospho-CoA kinase